MSWSCGLATAKWSCVGWWDGRDDLKMWAIVRESGLKWAIGVSSEFACLLHSARSTTPNLDSMKPRCQPQSLKSESSDLPVQGTVMGRKTGSS